MALWVQLKPPSGILGQVEEHVRIKKCFPQNFTIKINNELMWF